MNVCWRKLRKRWAHPHSTPQCREPLLRPPWPCSRQRRTRISNKPPSRPTCRGTQELYHQRRNSTHFLHCRAHVIPFSIVCAPLLLRRSLLDLLCRLRFRLRGDPGRPPRRLGRFSGLCSWGHLGGMKRVRKGRRSNLSSALLPPAKEDCLAVCSISIHAY